VRRASAVRLLAAGAGALLLAGAFAAVRPAAGERGRWVRVERRDLLLGAAVEGELAAVDSADLRPPQIPELWDFRISFMAPEGAEVSSGDPVLAFDTTQLEQKLQEKIAERDSAAKELEQKSRNLELERQQQELTLVEARGRLRRAELQLAVPEEVKPRAELEKARIDQRLAELEIASLEAGLEHHRTASAAELEAMRGRRDRAAARAAELEQHIQQMTVRAPRAGTVMYARDWRGDRKKIGDSSWRAETIITIPDLGRMRAEGEVTEADAGRVAAGQRVTLRLEAHPDREYGGVVRVIRRSVQAKSVSNPQKVVRLAIELPSTDTKRMRPGMRFRGQVVAERLTGVLAVPKDAVTFTPSGGMVRTRTLLGTRELFPRLGRRNPEAFEVLGGLDEGDSVLLRNQGKEGAP
jgi:HlyD family secretion protein